MEDRRAKTEEYVNRVKNLNKSSCKSDTMMLVHWRKKVESAHILCICAYVGFMLLLFVIWGCVRVFNVAFAEKCMGCGGFNVSAYVWQLSVMSLSVSPLVVCPCPFPFSLFLSLSTLPPCSPSPPSSEYLHESVFIVSLYLCVFCYLSTCVSSPGQ